MNNVVNISIYNGFYNNIINNANIEATDSCNYLTFDLIMNCIIYKNNNSNGSNKNDDNNGAIQYCPTLYFNHSQNNQHLSLSNFINNNNNHNGLN